MEGSKRMRSSQVQVCSTHWTMAVIRIGVFSFLANVFILKIVMYTENLEEWDSE